MEKNRPALIIRRIALVVVWLIGMCFIWELEKLINFRGAKKFDNWIHIFEWALVPVTLCLVLMRSGFRGNLWYWMGRT